MRKHLPERSISVICIISIPSNLCEIYHDPFSRCAAPHTVDCLTRFYKSCGALRLFRDRCRAPRNICRKCGQKGFQGAAHRKNSHNAFSKNQSINAITPSTPTQPPPPSQTPETPPTTPYSPAHPAEAPSSPKHTSPTTPQPPQCSTPPDGAGNTHS